MLLVGRHLKRIWPGKSSAPTVPKVYFGVPALLMSHSGKHYPNLYPICAYLFTEVEFKYLWWCIYIEQ